MSFLHIHDPELLLPIPPDDTHIICPDRPEVHEFLNVVAAEEAAAAARDEAEDEALLPLACLGWDRLLINTEDMVVPDATEASRDELIYSYTWPYNQGLARCECGRWTWPMCATSRARVVNGLVQPCLACQGLSHNSRFVHMWLLAHSPPNKANFMYHSLRSLLHTARISRGSERTLWLRVQQQALKVDPMRPRVTVHERVEHALREGKVSRVATVFNTANRRGFSTARLTAYPEDPVRANRTRYTDM